jgi:hypothetical protein
MRGLTANGSSTKWGTGILHNADVMASLPRASVDPPTKH